MPTVLVLGGYGAFGTLIARNLAREQNFKIILAGRNNAQAMYAAHQLRNNRDSRATIESTQIDAQTCSPRQLSALGAHLVINASGPFQHQDYSLATAAINAGIHYLDLADDRCFVTGIATLHGAATTHGVTVVSGASTLPGLSSAVVAHHARSLGALDTVEIGISPGNAFTPGLATARSILSYVGKPFESVIDGKKRTIHGWQDLKRHTFPDIGTRLMSNVEVPDLDLLPKHHPNLKTLTIQAGLELSALHLGLFGASKLVRAGLIPSLAPTARPAHAIKRALSWLGTDTGGMFVKTTGRDSTDQPVTQTWYIVAMKDDGPYIPTIASAILTKILLNDRYETTPLKPGAYACMNLFSLDQFEAETSGLGLDITYDTKTS